MLKGELTPELRALRARAGTLGAFTQHALHDTRETTSAARAAFNDRFVNLVDPKRELPEAERLRRAEAARKAYFQRLSMKGLATRRAARKRAQAGVDISGITSSANNTDLKKQTPAGEAGIAVSSSRPGRSSRGAG
jgi:hypothetical protein